jgi:hypothetical protein
MLRSQCSRRLQLLQDCSHEFGGMERFAHAGKFTYLDAAQQQFFVDIT